MVCRLLNAFALPGVPDPCHWVPSPWLLLICDDNVLGCGLSYAGVQDRMDTLDCAVRVERGEISSVWDAWQARTKSALGAADDDGTHGSGIPDDDGHGGGDGADWTFWNDDDDGADGDGGVWWKKLRRLILLDTHLGPTLAATAATMRRMARWADARRLDIRSSCLWRLSMPWGLGWGGAIFDTAVGPMLVCSWYPIHMLGIIGTFVFHLSNSIMFGARIFCFPYVMLAGNAVFSPHHSPLPFAGLRKCLRAFCCVSSAVALCAGKSGFSLCLLCRMWLL